MLKRLVLIAICAVFLGTALVTAQQPPPPPPAPKSEAQPTPPPPPPPPRAFGQPVTIRIDLTITDQAGTGAPTKKTMTVLAADGERASVRSLNRGTQGGPAPNANFNVDVRPILTQDRIRLDLSIFYDPQILEIPVPGSEKPVATATNLQESMGVILDNGKPLVVSQSADPRTDRKVTVEVKATILK